MSTNGAAGRARGSLTREEIVAAAIGLVDHDGWDAFSMRRLAAALGVAPMALYTHVRAKSDLADALVDQLYAGLDLDLDPGGDWFAQLLSLAHAVRDQFLAHPGVVPLALERSGIGEHTLRIGETIYGVLRPSGFDDDAVVTATYALTVFILGFVTLELPRVGVEDEDREEAVRRRGAMFAGLPARTYPHHVALAPALARSRSTDAFDRSVRLFLSGLAASRR